METKTALLNAAERASRTHGYDGFSYADLAREVGIKKASIHHHFPGKADLALALIKRYQDNFEQALTGISARQNLGGAKLQAYLDAYRAGMSGGKTMCLAVAFSIGRESLPDEVVKELHTFHQDSITWLTELFKMGKKDKSIKGVNNPEFEAAACLALVEGAQLQARASEDLARFDIAISALQQRINL